MSSSQCYEYRFGARFGLSIGTEYFDTSLFRCIVLELPLYVYIHISN